jgi:sulfur carrier protein
MIIINGEPSEVAPGATVDELLAQLDIDGERGVAVAVDAEVIPRGAWASFAIADGARVEVLIAVQGG